MKMKVTYATFCSAKPATDTQPAQPECVFLTTTFYPSGKSVRAQLQGQYIDLVPEAALGVLEANDGVQCTTVEKVAESRSMPFVRPFEVNLPANWVTRPAAEEPRLVDGELVIEPTTFWLNSPEQVAAFKARKALADAPSVVQVG